MPPLGKDLITLAQNENFQIKVKFGEVITFNIFDQYADFTNNYVLYSSLNFLLMYV